jgi:hypothetical protein
MKLQHAGDISLLMTKAQGESMDLIALQNQTIRVLGMDNSLHAVTTRAGRAFSVVEPRTLETDKSRYGPSGVETYYAMAESGLVEVTTDERWAARMGQGAA